MTVEDIWVADPRVSLRDIGIAAVLCNDANNGVEGTVGDPTEVALLTWAETAGVEVNSTRTSMPRRDVIPFESERQYMATLHENGNAYLKGAPEVILSHCTGVDSNAVHDQVHDMADRGLRVLAFATKSELQVLHHDNPGQGWCFLGLVGMIDPPRPEAIEAVSRCQSAGIQIKMITGDHKKTAVAIANELGIKQGGPALTGKELAVLSDHDFEEAALSTSVFARVAPEHKLRLVKALQKRGHVVAMTGDGVNDATRSQTGEHGYCNGNHGNSGFKRCGGRGLDR